MPPPACWKGAPWDGISDWVPPVGYNPDEWDFPPPSNETTPSPTSKGGFDQVGEPCVTDLHGAVVSGDGANGDGQGTAATGFEGERGTKRVRRSGL